MKEIIVTGCANCPFFQHDSDEGSICNHPSNGEVGVKDVSFGHRSGYYHTPDMCPLKQVDITVKAADSLKTN